MANGINKTKNCPKCKTNMKKVMVFIEGTEIKAESFQCPKCERVEFGKKSSAAVVEDLRKNEKK